MKGPQASAAVSAPVSEGVMPNFPVLAVTRKMNIEMAILIPCP
jgi:hypothetical protein